MTTTLPLPVASRPPAAPPTRPAGDSTPAERFLLAAEQAVRDELGIIEALANAHARGEVLPINESRHCRTIAAHLRARADMFEQLATRIVQSLG